MSLGNNTEAFRQYLRSNVNAPVIKTALEVAKKHGIDALRDPNNVWHLVKNFRRIALATGSLSADEKSLDKDKLKGLRVLDLACGTEDIPLPHKKFAPWICRTLAELGADVTGVDMKLPTFTGTGKNRKPATESGWNFVQRDLLQVGAIDQKTFPDNTYDVVICTAFAGYADTIRNDPHVERIRKASEDRYLDIITDIDEQVLRVLQEGALYLRNDSVFVKSGNDLKHKIDFSE